MKKRQKASDITYRNRFFWTSLILFFILSSTGFWIGAHIGIDYTISLVGPPKGMGALFHMFIGGIFAIIGWVYGILLTFIIDHRLAKRWRGRLGGGKHPALKLTLLSFLTFLAIIFIYLAIGNLFIE